MTYPLATLSPHARAFLHTVQEGLSDLPAEDGADLLAQVEQRLRDLDTDQDPEAISSQLGAANALVLELRAAAGFPPPHSPPRRSATNLDTVRAVLADRRVRPVIDYVASLRPAWWALRGYLLLAGVLAAISRGGGYRLHTLGSYSAASRDTTSPTHQSAAWLLIPAAAVVLSIVAGRLRPRLPRAAQLAIGALNITAVILLIAYPTWWMAPAFGYYTGLVS